MNIIHYENVPPSADNCGICHDRLSGDVVAHKKVLAFRNNRYLHPMHRECIKTELVHRANCPICREPVSPIFPLSLTLKKKLITILGAGISYSAISAIAKAVFPFKCEDLLFGLAGTIGSGLPYYLRSLSFAGNLMPLPSIAMVNAIGVFMTVINTQFFLQTASFANLEYEQIIEKIVGGLRTTSKPRRLPAAR